MDAIATSAPRPPGQRLRILVAFAAIMFLGMSAGAAGVLLLPQAADYGVDKTTISLVFISFAIGYILCALANGPLIARLGIRSHLMLGVAVSAMALAAASGRPAFWLLLVLQVILGYGMGALDAGLNAYLSGLERSRSLLNFFHGFFGVGALLGPVGAAAVLDRGFAWTAVYGLLAALAVPLLAALAVFPAQPRLARGAAGATPATVAPAGRSLVGAALAYRGVWIGAALLAIYVGIETAFGNWGFAFLTEERGQGVLMAGWVVSGYWGGLTLGRFVLNAVAERFGVGMITLTAGCIGAAALSTMVVWAASSAVATTGGLVAVGFFLGPIFPVMIAAVPRLVPQRLVATAVGILMATSIGGSAFFPWLVGVAADRSGAWVLLPVAIGLAVLLGLCWWRVAVRLRAPRLDPVPIEP